MNSTMTPVDTRQHIEDALTLLIEPGGVSELRVPIRPGRTISGYYDDVAKMAQAAAGLSGKYPGVYFIPNPVHPDLKARAYNRTQDYAKQTTADSDILRRAWLLVDFDPVRPAGVSSTDQQHEAALSRANDCKLWAMKELGFPEPLPADSGNGSHLMWRIDLPNDSSSLELVERCLKAFDFRFTDAVVGVDLKTGNAARIWKLYGTQACKGDNLPERPHRQSRLLDVPASLSLASLDQLQNLADTLPPQPKTPARSGSPPYQGGEFDLEGWLTRNGLPVVSSGSWNSGTKYILNPCPWNAAHNNRSAYVVRHANGAIAAGCHHNGCAGNDWHTLRALYEDRGPKTNSYSNGHSSEPVPERDEEYEAAAPGTSAPAFDKWPESPGPLAFSGLAGDVVRAADSHTEADRVGVLGTYLAYVAACVGAGPHFKVGETRHAPRIFLLLIGDTSKARKGESESPVRAILERADLEFISQRVQSGASSGEGLIYHVRDATDKDEGVTDKRLLVRETEFASVLGMIARQGNILSPVIRNAWDRGDLQTLTRNAPLKATGAHIVILGHITVEELRRELTSTQVANGFQNRFLNLAVRRSKLLPRPEPIDLRVLEQLAYDTRQVLDHARTVDRMQFTGAGADLWDEVYADLSKPLPGLVGSILARSEAQVLRLSMLYALLDMSSYIDVPHLQAAIALWSYSERSAYHIFADATGDPVADAVYRALKNGGALSRTQINKMFGGHESTDRIHRALRTLFERGLARPSYVETDGRRAEYWEAA